MCKDCVVVWHGASWREDYVTLPAPLLNSRNVSRSKDADVVLNCLSFNQEQRLTRGQIIRMTRLNENTVSYILRSLYAASKICRMSDASIQNGQLRRFRYWRAA